MKLTVKTDYDTEADAAYLEFAPVLDGEATQQIMIEDPRLKDGDIVIDLDSNGHVLGIELIGVMSMISRPRIE
jgi:uncharacterized protein YuzE